MLTGILRAGVFGLGLAGLGWSTLTLPEFRTTAVYSAVADRILAGEPFREADLAISIAALDALPALTVPYARFRRAEPMLRLRSLEMALDSANAIGLDASMESLSAGLRASLRGNPADPLVWAFLCWLENLRIGNSVQNAAYLNLSYALGPLEGEVALRRNRMALVAFQNLAPDTQDRVVSEFAGMVDARFLDVVAPNLAMPGWTQRDRLLAGLGDVDLAAKQALVKIFGIEGIRLVIPGMPDVEERPWRK